MTRPVRRRPTAGHFVAVVILLAVIGRFVVGVSTGGNESPPFESFQEGPCTIREVQSADVMVIRQGGRDGGQRRAEVSLKLIGIESPGEMDALRDEATDFSRQFLQSGLADLRLDRRRFNDQSQLVGYLYVDGRMLNEELLRAGLARLSPYPGDNQSIERRLRKAQGEAEINLRGIWSAGHSQLVSGKPR